MKHPTAATAAAAVLVLFAVAAAADPPKDKPRRGPPRPPPEAYEACAKANEGDTCTVKLRDRSITGICAEDPDAALFCLPDRPPPPPPDDAP